MRAFSSIAVALLLVFCASGARAVDPAEQLKDPALEARAREISAHLRCLVCQNQSIDDSDATLAKDLRVLVRRQLEKGETNEQVIDYIVARYGEFVLLRPRFHLNTLLLWLAPLLLVGGGIFLASRVMKRQPQAETSARPLTPEEQAELDKLLATGPEKTGAK